MGNKNTLEDCKISCNKDYLDCLSDFSGHRDCIHEKYVCLDLCKLHYGF